MVLCSDGCQNSFFLLFILPSRCMSSIQWRCLQLVVDKAHAFSDVAALEVELSF